MKNDLKGAYMDLNSKVDRVKEILKDKKVGVGFSGGADSTALLSMAADVAKKAVAFTVDTGLLPGNLIRSASEIADEIGVEHIVITHNLLESPEFTSNTPIRCFVCKNIIYSLIKDQANKMGLDLVLDGTNLSDMLEDRPGVAVNRELGIVSPLLVAGMRRGDVIEYLKRKGIRFEAETTCLATRIKQGQEVTPEKINRVHYAETLLRNFAGPGKIRVRDEGGSAVIELENYSDILNIDLLMHFESELRSVGFDRVLLNLSGYRKPEDDIILYKPCREAEAKIMFEMKLPYSIDIESSCSELGEVAKVKCSEKMGVVMLEINGRSVTIFRNGKIVSRKIENREEAEEVLVEVLPHIVRSLDINH